MVPLGLCPAFSCNFRDLLGVPLYCSRPSGAPASSGMSPAVHVAGPVRRSPCWAALRPLGLASTFPLLSPLNVLVLTPAPPLPPPQGPRVLPTPGAPLCVPPGGVGWPLLGLGCSVPPVVVGVSRPMPLVAHGCLPLRHRLALCSPPAAFPWGPGVSSCLTLSHLCGLYP